MAQIQKGTTYSTGDQVTAANLNALADAAILLPGAITDQTAKAVPLAADTLLIHSAADTALRKSTLTQLFASPQPIGATTPSTVAATTLSATGDVTASGGNILSTSGGAIPIRVSGATTGYSVIRIQNTGGDTFFGAENSTGNNLIIGCSAYDTIIRGPSGIAFSANAGAGMQMRISSSGAAITGTLSVSGVNNSLTAAAPTLDVTTGSTTFTIRHWNGSAYVSPLQTSISGAAITGSLSATGIVSSTAGGTQFLLTGQAGNPAYIKVDQTANSGKVWRVGNTGAGSFNTFEIYNQTDNVTAGSFSSSGLVVNASGSAMAKPLTVIGDGATYSATIAIQRNNSTSSGGRIDFIGNTGTVGARYSFNDAIAATHEWQISGTTYMACNTNGLYLPWTTSIYGSNGTISLPMLKFSYMGYSANWGTTIVGSASGNNTICIGYDPSGNTSGGFNGDGREVLFRNSMQFRTPNSANTGYIDFLVLDASANVRIPTNLTVTGSLSKGSGSFRIDHPLPAKKETHQLVHSFIEGPKADLIYRGKVDLVDGKAAVNIDTAATMTEGTFEVLCRDVQCFTTNETGWTPVRGKVTGNILTIEAQDASCTDSISWMVVGERCDPHMMETEWTDDNGRVIVEPLKPVEPEIAPKE